MNGNRAMKKIAGRGRCGHKMCATCATKRGRNRGTRRARYASKRTLLQGSYDG